MPESTGPEHHYGDGAVLPEGVGEPLQEYHRGPTREWRKEEHPHPPSRPQLPARDEGCQRPAHRVECCGREDLDGRHHVEGPPRHAVRKRTGDPVRNEMNDDADERESWTGL